MLLFRRLVVSFFAMNRELTFRVIVFVTLALTLLLTVSLCVVRSLSWCCVRLQTGVRGPLKHSILLFTLLQSRVTVFV